MDVQDFETAATIERLSNSYQLYRTATRKAEKAPHQHQERRTIAQISGLDEGRSVSVWGCPEQLSEHVVLECSATRYVAHAHIVYLLRDLAGSSIEMHDRFSFLLAGSERAAKRYLTRRRLSDEFMNLECVVTRHRDSRQLSLAVNLALEM